MTTQEQMNQSVMGTYGRFPVVIDHGAGESCADETGKQYIDFGSGIGTTSLGYCNEAWTEAVCKHIVSKALRGDCFITSSLLLSYIKRFSPTIDCINSISAYLISVLSSCKSNK